MLGFAIEQDLRLAYAQREGHKQEGEEAAAALGVLHSWAGQGAARGGHGEERGVARQGVEKARPARRVCAWRGRET